jgi:hypothetical protein
VEEDAVEEDAVEEETVVGALVKEGFALAPQLQRAQQKGQEAGQEQQQQEQEQQFPSVADRFRNMPVNGTITLQVLYIVLYSLSHCRCNILYCTHYHTAGGGTIYCTVLYSLSHFRWRHYILYCTVLAIHCTVLYSLSDCR